MLRLTMGRLAWAAALLGAAAPVCTAEDAADATIIRDIAIIGGGGSGAYAAIALQQDYNRSVVIIEKESILGGHVNSWTDPSTNRSYDCGVQNYLNLTGAQRHFDRLGVPMQLNVRTTNTQRYVDFTTGKELKDYIPPATADRNDAFKRYVEVVEQYRSHMEPGYHNYWPAREIPEELLLPFAQFVEKHNLSVAVPQFWYTTGFGTHNMMERPTAAVIRSLSPDLILTLLNQKTALVPVSRRNQDIYDRSQVVIGEENILFDSTVQSSTLPCDDKTGTGNVTLMVLNHKTGKTTKIVAKRLIFTAQPTTPNLAPIAIKDSARRTMRRFQNSAAYVAVVAHPALPVNTTLINTPAAAAPQNYALAVPGAPFNTRFEQYENSRFYRAIATGQNTMTAEQAKKVMQDALDRMLAEGTIVDPNSGPPEKLSFMEFQSHGLTGMHPNATDMRCGFFEKVMSHQGECGVFFTGASWGIGISTSLWQEVEVTLKNVVQSLSGR